MFEDVPQNLPTGTPPASKDASLKQPTPAPIVDEGKELRGSADGTLQMPESPEPKSPVAPPPSESNIPAVDDMFADVDDGSVGAVPTPSLPDSNVPQAPKRGGKKGAGKLILLIVLIVAVLGALGAAAYFFLSSDDVQPPGTEPLPDMGIVPGDFGEPVPTPTLDDKLPKDDVPVEPVTPVVELDSDSDGLTDAQEVEYGTSIHKPDSDNDGLFDKEEIMVYKTNPLRADTDNDGFLDGSEVQSGYDPNGPGQLIGVPQ